MNNVWHVPYPRYIAEDVGTIENRGGLGAIHCYCGFGDDPIGYLNNWLLGRLLWDADADPRALLAEWCSAAFGAEAAAPMVELLESFEIEMEKIKNPPYAAGLMGMIDRPALAREAFAKAGTLLQRRRLHATIRRWMAHQNHLYTRQLPLDRLIDHRLLAMRRVGITPEAQKAVPPAHVVLVWPRSEGLLGLELRSGGKRNPEYTWAYVNKQGHSAIGPAEFQWARPFAQGLAAVMKDHRWGYIDKTGKMVIEPGFEEAWSFREGLAAVRTGRTCGYIARTGKLVVAAAYRAAFDFSEGLAAVEQDGKWGFIDKQGKMVVEPRFGKARGFREGLAAVRLDGKWGYVDAKGKVAIAPQFMAAWDFSEGLARVVTDGKWGYIDKTGKTAIEPRFRGARDFSEGLAAVLLKDTRKRRDGREIEPVPHGDHNTLIRKHWGWAWGYIDKTGKVVISPRFYGDVRDFHDGTALTDLDGWRHRIDRTGRRVRRDN